ncbi:hypothetical protein Pcinc_032928 [Petrolisthes cinctipes]|uniref:C2H2-type domain-containing protein n=1 Tax=Petrolisthes cinctipes TaxID=88211 RepID=A0AAE1K2M6_PETCI|nr:hypothetical protein Pcinc_032928 [Petrolisthes cinctipes]
MSTHRGFTSPHYNSATPTVRDKQGSSTGRTPRRPCNYCHKDFAFASDLERHMRIHTGEKPFACSLCPYRSSQRYNLLRHRRVHVAKAVEEWHPQQQHQPLATSPQQAGKEAEEWSQPPLSPHQVVVVSKVGESQVTQHSPPPHTPPGSSSPIHP